MINTLSIERLLNSIVAFALLSAFLYTIPLWVGSYILSLLISILTFITLCGAWNIFSGYTGYIFLGSSAFYGLGAYMVALLPKNVPFFGVIILTGILCAVIAFLLGIPFLRIRGIYFTICSYAFSMLLLNIFRYYEQTYSSTIGRWVPVQDITIIYSTIVTITIITLSLAYLIRSHRFYYGLISIKSDEDAAEMMGVNTFFIKIIAFTICGMLMGATGAANAPLLGYIDPFIAFDQTTSFNTLIFSMFGGAGNITGGIISSSILSILFEYARAAGMTFHFLFACGFIIFITTLFMPRGIGGTLIYLHKVFRSFRRSRHV